jgi:hypothetical protein
MRWRLSLAALMIAVSQAAYADEDRLHHPAPPSSETRFVECDPKSAKPKPCHVHDPRTADKMNRHTPALKDPHARQEYEAWRAGKIPQMY